MITLLLAFLKGAAESTVARELVDASGWIAELLIRRAVHRLPHESQQRMSDEWRGEIEFMRPRSGRLAVLVWSAWVYVKSWKHARALRNEALDINKGLQAQNFHIGDTLRVGIIIGAEGTTGNMWPLMMHRLRFELGPKGLGLVSFNGRVFSTDGARWSSSHSRGDAFPSAVSLTPDCPVLISPGNSKAFLIEFDVRICGLNEDGSVPVFDEDAIRVSCNDVTCKGSPPDLAASKIIKKISVKHSPYTEWW